MADKEDFKEKTNLAKLITHKLINLIKGVGQVAALHLNAVVVPFHLARAVIAVCYLVTL